MNNTMMILLMVFPVVVVIVFSILIPRFRMERRARALLAQHPGAERTSVSLPFRSTWASGKRREMDAKIAEMRADGWTFLRAVEASPLRTIPTWGGSLTLQFIRVSSLGSS